jgi:hypothetical protein
MTTGEIRLRDMTADDYAELAELFTRVYPDDPD